jgi:phage terminase small subunit
VTKKAAKKKASPTKKARSPRPSPPPLPRNGLPAPPVAKLTARQARFVDEYLITLSASEAARRAGYVKKHADVTGPRLLGNVGVAAEIARRQAERAVKTGITQERVLLETSLLAFSDVTHYLVDEQGNVVLAPGAPPDAMRALQSIKRKFTKQFVAGEWVTVVEVEVKLWDKPGVLKLAGRHVGLFPDKVEVSGPNGGPVPVAAIQRVVVDVRSE